MFGQVVAEDVFEPADDLHAALFRGREHLGENVEIAEVGRARSL